MKKNEINSSNESGYYLQAKKLCEIDNRDSLFEAYRILTRLHYFDSSKYSRQFLKDDFAKIETTNLNYYKTSIPGVWNFEWSGSSWGTAETSKSKKATVIFTENEALFYIGDTLTRQAKYSITNKYSRFLSKEIFFELYFFDNKDIWYFILRTSGADYNAKLKFGGKNIGLYINESQFCNDCPQTIYLKEGAENYQIGQLANARL